MLKAERGQKLGILHQLAKLTECECECEGKVLEKYY